MRNKTITCLLFTAIFGLMGFTYQRTPANYTAGKTIKTDEGKAYWYSYYNNGNDKKLYITQVYNNDCNYCSNEITAAFKKWLILNDYENTVTTVNIDNLNDIEAASLETRRENTIIKYKGYGYSIVRVGFTYKEE
ncbi:MAG: hypothetical protein H7320_03195 [Ferruginibacter sp.]|nr:hypothetical protein [Ferruginibacter sp.]